MMKKGLSASTLKWIAIVSMLIDHYAIAVYWQQEQHVYEVYRVLRYMGRIAFPIYCFLLVEGFFHTKNIKKYIGRCFLFALISEIPYDMAIRGKVFDPEQQNAYFTLVTGLCTMYALNRIKGVELTDTLKRLGCIAIGAGVAQILDFDYHYLGVLFIVMFYFFKVVNPPHKDIVGAVAFSYEITAPLAFVPIHLYDGRRGQRMKYFFYLVYPLHLAVFGVIRLYL